MKKILSTFALVALVSLALLAATSTPIKGLRDGVTAVTTDLVEISRSELGGERFSPYSLQLADVMGTSTAAELNKLDGIPSTAYMAVTELASFTESAATAYTYTFEIAAGTLVHDVCFVNTVLWGGTTASLIVGDDDDDNGWFEATDLKATALLVGEVLCAGDDATWGGEQGAYLVAATGRRGRVTAGVDSGWYYGAASEIIMVVAAGTPSTTGRSFGWVTFSTPTATASTDT